MLVEPRDPADKRQRTLVRLGRVLRLDRRRRAPVVVLAAGLVITAVLAWLAYIDNSRNEQRLLKSQVRQTGAVLQTAVPAVQTPLASAAEISAANGGDAAAFEHYFASYIGGSNPFVSAALIGLDREGPRVIAEIGQPAVLALRSSRAAAFLIGAARTGELGVFGPIAGRPDRVGYAYASSGAAPSYLIYAESVLPPGRRVVIQKGSPFADLRFALYLGSRPDPARLLETDVARLPLGGPTATTVIPFGDAKLTLVAGSSSQLSGPVSAALWWIIAIGGVLLTAGGAFTAWRLAAGRAAAEQLTVEVRSLLGEQRTIAEALQHALLPKKLPDVPVLEITARYLPGTDGMQIGGDWYDVVPLDEQRFFFVVGDVSGRGLEAGSVMASLMFAIRGFASQGLASDEVLTALARLLAVERDKHFATVLCGVLDLAAHTVTIANAGHLPPLLASAQRTEFLATPIGAPIGVVHSEGYVATTVPVPSEATLLAYTDGLIERRGETLDDGLRRLMDTVVSSGRAGEALVEDIMNALVPHGCDDDTAILALRWQQ